MKRIYLYLFVFSLAINIFQYVSASKMMKEKDQDIENLHKRLNNQKDTISKLNQQINTSLPS